MLSGSQILGSKIVQGSEKAVHGINPATGEMLEPAYAGGTHADIEKACALAKAAFPIYRATDSETRAVFLEAIAEQILALGDILIQRAMDESGLPRARLEGERGRTVNQLKLFATILREKDWQGVCIETALPERQPPKPDLRMRNIPLGPVVVFGASNFPLAFSVAGGDTASALAAGAPVIVKAHTAHPGTSELVGRAIQSAVKIAGMPEGVFSLLYLNDHAKALSLVSNPVVKAVGFTGSRNAGLAIQRTAFARAEPIPVYAEMSSINPVFLLPHTLQNSAETIAQGFVGSLLMGAGQFCTNPGLLVAVKGDALNRFKEIASGLIAGSAAQTMLTPGIHAAYEKGVQRLASHNRVSKIAEGKTGATYQCQAALFETSYADFIADPVLAEENFGSSALIVVCDHAEQMLEFIERIEGQLTATLHVTQAADAELVKKIIPLLELKVGRILFNGYPTGVEVGRAMVHGGPFPATSDSRTTSVGAAAIKRFLRPVCYQDFPTEFLAEELRGN